MNKVNSFFIAALALSLVLNLSQCFRSSVEIIRLENDNNALHNFVNDSLQAIEERYQDSLSQAKQDAQMYEDMVDEPSGASLNLTEDGAFILVRVNASIDFAPMESENVKDVQAHASKYYESLQPCIESLINLENTPTDESKY